MTTGKESGSGTTSRIFMTVYGKTLVCPRLRLYNGEKAEDFRRGNSSKFNILLDDPGVITKIR